MLSYTLIKATGEAPITTLFSHLKISKTAKRYRDFVLMPELPVLNVTDQGLIIEDEDSRELAQFCINTIRLLSNQTSKHLTYPFPLFPVKLEELGQSDLANFYRKHSLEPCVNMIRNESQYRIALHIVGHGTPESIGFVDIRKQVSPEIYAARLQSLLDHYGLTELKQKRMRFVFHTCNSAYVDVRAKSREEVLANIKKYSFIGRFYQAMKEWGMKDLEVVGYRGYYASYTSSGAGSASIQDSFCNPKIVKDAAHGEYIVSEQGCSAPCVSDTDLFFPVTVYSTTSQHSFDQEYDFTLKRAKKIRIKG